MKQIHLIFYGKVQGVFYRDNTQKKASELRLKGYVRNLQDGTVEAIVQGSEEKLKELIEFCKNNPGYSKVEKIDVEEQELSDEFDGFEVRY